MRAKSPIMRRKKNRVNVKSNCSQHIYLHVCWCASPTQTDSAVSPGKWQHAIMATWQSLSPRCSRHPVQVLSARQPDSIPPPLAIVHLHVLDKSTLNCLPFYSNDALNRLHSKFIFSQLNAMQPVGPYQALPFLGGGSGPWRIPETGQRRFNEWGGGIMSANQRVGMGGPGVRETMSNPS